MRCRHRAFWQAPASQPARRCPGSSEFISSGSARHFSGAPAIFRPSRAATARETAGRVDRPDGRRQSGRDVVWTCLKGPGGRMGSGRRRLGRCRRQRENREVPSPRRTVARRGPWEEARCLAYMARVLLTVPPCRGSLRGEGGDGARVASGVLLLAAPSRRTVAREGRGGGTQVVCQRCLLPSSVSTDLHHFAAGEAWLEGVSEPACRRRPPPKPRTPPL
jgi:hypothetical protein